MPKCEAHGAKLIIGGAYNSGILATGVKRGGEIYYNYETPPLEIIERVRKIEEVCDSHNTPIAAAALKFPLYHELVVNVIPGMGSRRRVMQTMDLYKTDIPDQLWSDLRTEGLLHSEAPTP